MVSDKISRDNKFCSYGNVILQLLILLADSVTALLKLHDGSRMALHVDIKLGAGGIKARGSDVARPAERITNAR